MVSSPIYAQSISLNVFLLTVVADDSRSGGHGVNSAPRSHSTDIRVRAMVIPCLSTGETYICIFCIVKPFGLLLYDYVES